MIYLESDQDFSNYLGSNYIDANDTDDSGADDEESQIIEKSDNISPRARSLLTSKEVESEIAEELRHNEWHAVDKPTGEINLTKCELFQNELAECFKKKFDDGEFGAHCTKFLVEQPQTAGGYEEVKSATSKFLRTYFCRKKSTPGKRVTIFNAKNLTLAGGYDAALDMVAFILFSAADVVLCVSPFSSRVLQSFEERSQVELRPVPFKNLLNPRIEVNTFQAAYDKATSRGKQVRGIFIQNPCKCTGVHFTYSEVEALCQWAFRLGLCVIIDEGLEDNVENYKSTENFDDTDENRIFKVSELFEKLDAQTRQKVICVWSPGIDLCLPGLQFSAVYSENLHVQKTLRRLEVVQPCASLVQAYVLRIFKNIDEIHELLMLKRNRLKEDRNFIFRRLTQMGIRYVKASSGSVIFIDLSPYIRNGEFHGEQSLWRKLWNSGTYINPGSLLGAPQPGWFQIGITLERQAMEQGLSQLEKTIFKHKRVVFESTSAVKGRNEDHEINLPPSHLITNLVQNKISTAKTNEEEIKSTLLDVSQDKKPLAPKHSPAIIEDHHGVEVAEGVDAEKCSKRLTEYIHQAQNLKSQIKNEEINFDADMIRMGKEELESHKDEIEDKGRKEELFDEKTIQDDENFDYGVYGRMKDETEVTNENMAEIPEHKSNKSKPLELDERDPQLQQLHKYNPFSDGIPHSSTNPFKDDELKNISSQSSSSNQREDLINAVFRPFDAAENTKHDDSDDIKDEILRKVFAIFPPPEKWDELEDPFGDMESSYVGCGEDLSFENYDSLTRLQRRLLLASRIRWANEQAHKNYLVKRLSAIPEQTDDVDADFSADQDTKKNLAEEEELNHRSSETVTYTELDSSKHISPQKSLENIVVEGDSSESTKNAEHHKDVLEHKKFELKKTKLPEEKEPTNKINLTKSNSNNDENSVNSEEEKNKIERLNDLEFIRHLVEGGADNYAPGMTEQKASQRSDDTSDEILKKVFDPFEQVRPKQKTGLNEEKFGNEKFEQENEIHEFRSEVQSSDIPLTIDIPLQFTFNSEERSTEFVFRRRDTSENTEAKIEIMNKKNIYEEVSEDISNAAKQTNEYRKKSEEEKTVERTENELPMWSPSDSGLAPESVHSRSSSNDSIVIHDEIRSNIRENVDERRGTHFHVYLSQTPSSPPQSPNQFSDYFLGDAPLDSSTLNRPMVKYSPSVDNNQFRSDTIIPVKIEAAHSFSPVLDDSGVFLDSHHGSLSIDFPLLIVKESAQQKSEEKKISVEKLNASLINCLFLEESEGGNTKEKQLEDTRESQIKYKNTANQSTNATNCEDSSEENLNNAKVNEKGEVNSDFVKMETLQTKSVENSERKKLIAMQSWARLESVDDKEDNSNVVGFDQEKTLVPDRPLLSSSFSTDRYENEDYAHDVSNSQDQPTYSEENPYSQVPQLNAKYSESQLLSILSEGNFCPIGTDDNVTPYKKESKKTSITSKKSDAKVNLNCFFDSENMDSFSSGESSRNTVLKWEPLENLDEKAINREDSNVDPTTIQMTTTTLVLQNDYDRQKIASKDSITKSKKFREELNAMESKNSSVVKIDESKEQISSGDVMHVIRLYNTSVKIRAPPTPQKEEYYNPAIKTSKDTEKILKSDSTPFESNEDVDLRFNNTQNEKLASDMMNHVIAIEPIEKVQFSIKTTTLKNPPKNSQLKTTSEDSELAKRINENEDDIGIPLVCDEISPHFNSSQNTNLEVDENPSLYTCTISLRSKNENNTRNNIVFPHFNEETGREDWPKICVEASTPARMDHDGSPINQRLHRKEKGNHLPLQVPRRHRLPQIHHKLLMTRSGRSKSHSPHLNGKLDNEDLVLEHTNITEITYASEMFLSEIGREDFDKSELFTQTSTQINNYTPNEIFNQIYLKNSDNHVNNTNIEYDHDKHIRRNYYSISRFGAMKNADIPDEQQSNNSEEIDKRSLKNSSLKNLKKIEYLSDESQTKDCLRDESHRDCGVQTSQDAIESLCCRLRVLKASRKTANQSETKSANFENGNNDVTKSKKNKSDGDPSKYKNRKMHKHEFLVCRNPWHTSQQDHCNPQRLYMIRQSTMPPTSTRQNIEKDIPSNRLASMSNGSTIREVDKPSQISIRTREDPISGVHANTLTVRHTPGSNWIVSSVCKTTSFGLERTTFWDDDGDRSQLSRSSLVGSQNIHQTQI